VNLKNILLSIALAATSSAMAGKTSLLCSTNDRAYQGILSFTETDTNAAGMTDVTLFGGGISPMSLFCQAPGSIPGGNGPVLHETRNTKCSEIINGTGKNLSPLPMNESSKRDNSVSFAFGDVVLNCVNMENNIVK
jgi:hypothetical protein